MLLCSGALLAQPDTSMILLPADHRISAGAVSPAGTILAGGTLNEEAALFFFNPDGSPLETYTFTGTEAEPVYVAAAEGTTWLVALADGHVYRYDAATQQAEELAYLFDPTGDFYQLHGVVRQNDTLWLLSTTGTGTPESPTAVWHHGYRLRLDNFAVATYPLAIDKYFEAKLAIRENGELLLLLSPYLQPFSQLIRLDSTFTVLEQTLLEHPPFADMLYRSAAEIYLAGGWNGRQYLMRADLSGALQPIYEQETGANFNYGAGFTHLAAAADGSFYLVDYRFYVASVIPVRLQLLQVSADGALLEALPLPTNLLPNDFSAGNLPVELLVNPQGHPLLFGNVEQPSHGFMLLTPDSTALTTDPAYAEYGRVYPNPVTDYLSLTSVPPPGPMAIYDRNGQMVREVTTIPSGGIDVRALPPGWYVLRRLGEQGFSIPFVKQ